MFAEVLAVLSVLLFGPIPEPYVLEVVEIQGSDDNQRIVLRDAANFVHRLPDIPAVFEHGIARNGVRTYRLKILSRRSH